MMHAKKPAKRRAVQVVYRRGYLAGAQRWCRFQGALRRVLSRLADESGSSAPAC